MAILVATDFSPEAAEAERVAADLAVAMHTTLKLVHVLEPNTTFPLSLANAKTDIEDERWRAAQDLLEQAVVRLETSGVSADVQVLRGDVVGALFEEVLILPKELVVVGGCGVEGKASYRGLAEDIAQALPAPVLVIRAGADKLRDAIKQHQRLRVFVAIDRTQSSEPAIAWLSALRANMACDITVGHYFWPSHEYERLGIDANGEPYEANEALLAALERDIRQRFGELGGKGELAVHCQPYLASVSTELLDTARNSRAHLIVVGTHQRTRFGRFVHGSISSSVLRHSETPVVCVGAMKSQGRRPRPFNHILVATDLSDQGNACVAQAYELLHNRSGTITLLHVVAGPLDTIRHRPPKRVDELTLDTLQASLRGLIPEEINDTAIRTEIIVEDGGPVAERILQIAERVGADAIVLGSNGKNAFDRATLGSVAATVVNKATRPVVVYRDLPQ